MQRTSMVAACAENSGTTLLAEKCLSASMTSASEMCVPQVLNENEDREQRKGVEELTFEMGAQRRLMPHRGKDSIALKTAWRRKEVAKKNCPSLWSMTGGLCPFKCPKAAWIRKNLF